MAVSTPVTLGNLKFTSISADAGQQSITFDNNVNEIWLTCQGPVALRPADGEESSIFNIGNSVGETFIWGGEIAKNLRGRTLYVLADTVALDIIEVLNSV